MQFPIKEKTKNSRHILDREVHIFALLQVVGDNFEVASLWI
jgi:hypothetical protein